MKELLILMVSLKEEAGFAGGQPASNKADTYTVIKGSFTWLLFFYYR